MARAHTAGKEKHGNMATGLASFACLFFFLFRNSCGGKKGIHICEIFLKLLPEAENEPKAWRPKATTRPWFGGVWARA
jgi:hypothetical protein